MLKAIENICKDKMELQHVIKRISRDLLFDMICLFSITLPRLGDRRHQTSWIKTHIQPQTMEDILNLLICYFIDLLF